MASLFFFSSAESERSQLRHRFLTGVEPGAVQPFTGGERTDPLPLWSYRDTPRNRAFWTRLKAGDRALLYYDRRFRAAAVVERTLLSHELGEQWRGGSAPVRPLFLFFRDVRPVDVELDALNEALGYSSRFVPRGLFRPSDLRQLYLLEEYEGAEGFVGALAAGRAKPLAAEWRMRFTGPEELDDAEALRVTVSDTSLMHGAARVEVASAAPPPPIPPRPPFAYASIDSPTHVEREGRFPVRVGLVAERPAFAAGAGPIDLAAVGDRAIDVTVVGIGLDVADGPSRFELRVDPGRALPAMELAMEPAPGAGGAGLIYALFGVAGRTLGVAVRSVLVGGDPTRSLPPPPPTPLPPPSDGPTPDLTIEVLAGTAPGEAFWSLRSPHAVDLPARPLAVALGVRTEDFTRGLIAGVEQRELAGAPDLVDFLKGVGSRVADKVPPEFWPVLEAVADIVAALGRSRPTVLLLSREPDVPWELALLEEPLDPAAPPFLASQVTLGRWMLTPRRPAEPPASASADRMVVIGGLYMNKGPLPEARKEVRTLKERWSAAEVRPRLDDVLACLRGQPPWDVLHYAGHGESVPGPTDDGLLLNDDEWLVPDTVRGQRLATDPLVFLNACQVGAAPEALGDHGGMAEAFIYAGAVGVVAPLWSVLDGDARDLALSFYDEVFGGRPAAEVLADARAALGSDFAATTPLAFRFFGHPNMVVTRDAD